MYDMVICQQSSVHCIRYLRQLRVKKTLRTWQQAPCFHVTTICNRIRHGNETTVMENTQFLWTTQFNANAEPYRSLSSLSVFKVVSVLTSNQSAQALSCHLLTSCCCTTITFRSELVYWQTNYFRFGSSSSSLVVVLPTIVVVSAYFRKSSHAIILTT